MKRLFKIIKHYILILLFIAVLSPCACDKEDDGSSERNDSVSCALEGESCFDQECCLGLVVDRSEEEEGIISCICRSYYMICHLLEGDIDNCNINFSLNCPDDGLLYISCFDRLTGNGCSGLEECLHSKNNIYSNRSAVLY
jgi:hypothetical protein